MPGQKQEYYYNQKWHTPKKRDEKNVYKSVIANREAMALFKYEKQMSIILTNICFPLTNFLYHK